MAGGICRIAHRVKRGPDEARLKLSIWGPDVPGLQLIDHTKTGHYGPSSYCVRKTEVENRFRG